MLTEAEENFMLDLFGITIWHLELVDSMERTTSNRGCMKEETHNLFLHSGVAFWKTLHIVKR